jgi:hypothetical protein
MGGSFLNRNDTAGADDIKISLDPFRARARIRSSTFPTPQPPDQLHRPLALARNLDVVVGVVQLCARIGFAGEAKCLLDVVLADGAEGRRVAKVRAVFGVGCRLIDHFPSANLSLVEPTIRQNRRNGLASG